MGLTSVFSCGEAVESQAGSVASLHADRVHWSQNRPGTSVTDKVKAGGLHMPWKEISALDERIRLIEDYLGGRWSITELSGAYGVSRKTIYKWIGRYEAYGVEGLKERSRAPHRRSNAAGTDIGTRPPPG